MKAMKSHPYSHMQYIPVSVITVFSFRQGKRYRSRLKELWLALGNTEIIFYDISIVWTV